MANKINREANVLIGKMLQSARESCNVTQAEMGVAIDMSKHHVSALECGNSKASIEVLLGYCKKLGMTPNQILRYDDDNIIPELKQFLADLPEEDQIRLLEMGKILKKL